MDAYAQMWVLLTEKGFIYNRKSDCIQQKDYKEEKSTSITKDEREKENNMHHPSLWKTLFL